MRGNSAHFAANQDQRAPSANAAWLAGQWHFGKCLINGEHTPFVLVALRAAMSIFSARGQHALYGFYVSKGAGGDLCSVVPARLQFKHERRFVPGLRPVNYDANHDASPHIWQVPAQLKHVIGGIHHRTTVNIPPLYSHPPLGLALIVKAATLAAALQPYL